ncbi:MAG: tetratricopeptide repeat protein [Bacteroidales bacterium]
MDLATPETVVGDFDNAQIQRNGLTHRAYRRGNEFFLDTDGPDGQIQSYKVDYVFGYYPLQQYLIRFPGGRYQVAALNWSSLHNKWYYMADSVYAGEEVNAGNWLHWTRQSQNWNSMCADCHSTNLKKNYNPQNDTYNTTWSDIDVGCEACHGAGSRHIEWAGLSKEEQKKDPTAGLTVRTAEQDPVQYPFLCARCHSRRIALDDATPGYDLYNHTLPELPAPPHWYPDGQVRDEDYVFASFIQSKMYHSKIRCNNCHNVHSLKLRFEGDRLCFQCHQPDTFAVFAHTFHKPEWKVACVDCHMRGANFMGVDFRRDHSFRIPRPDLTIKFGVPNACNDCHDKSAEWAAEKIEQYSAGHSFHFSELLYDSVRLNQDSGKLLQSWLTDTSLLPVVKALALRHTDPVRDKELISDLLADTVEDMVRIEAIRWLPVENMEDLRLLLPLLTDSHRAVRYETARKLLGIDTSLIPEEYRSGFHQAVREYKSSLGYNADFPSGKFNLGVFFAATGRNDSARYWFEKAWNQDIQLTDAGENLAVLYAGEGNLDKSVEILNRLVELAPDRPRYHFQLGLAYAEMKDYRNAAGHLTKAIELNPRYTRAYVNLARIEFSQKNFQEAAELWRRIVTLEPDNRNYYIEWQAVLTAAGLQHQADSVGGLIEKLK